MQMTIVQQWGTMSVPERVELVKSLGMPGTLGSKAWIDLEEAEKQCIYERRQYSYIPLSTPTVPLTQVVRQRTSTRRHATSSIDTHIDTPTPDKALEDKFAALRQRLMKK